MYTRMLRKLEHRYGHIYMYRFRPEKRLRAWNSRALPAKTEQTRAIMHQILNNLDPDVAQFPHELITYGGTGSVFQNWGQFRLVMKYLSEMTDEQTLVMYVVHSLISHTFTYTNATRTFTNINTRTPRSNTGTLAIPWECSHHTKTLRELLSRTV